MSKISKYYAKLTDTKLRIPCRLAYANIWTPKSINGSEEKYSVSCLIDKEDQNVLAGVKKAIEVAAADGKSRLWNGKIPANLKTPLRDGDVERSEDESYVGHMFVNTTSKDAPQIVDRRKQEVTDPMKVYSGCYCLVTVNFYPFNANGNRGVAAGLCNIQFVADGERLSGKASADADFVELDEDEEVLGEDMPDFLS